MCVSVVDAVRACIVAGCPVRAAWHISGGEGASANTSCLRVLVIHDDDSETVEEVQDDLGLDKHNTAEIVRRLESQGITDIKKISLADAM